MALLFEEQAFLGQDSVFCMEGRATVGATIHPRDAGISRLRFRKVSRKNENAVPPYALMEEQGQPFAAECTGRPCSRSIGCGGGHKNAGRDGPRSPGDY